MRPLVISVPVFLFVSACRGSPPVDEQQDTVRSWTATAILTAQERSRGAINRAVVTQVKEKGEKALEESQLQLPHDSTSTVVLDSLRRALARLDAASRS